MNLLNFDERRKFIENAQKERQERAQNRQFKELSLKIGAIGRGVCYRKQLGQKIRRDFLEKYENKPIDSNIELLKQGQIVFNCALDNDADLQFTITFLKTLMQSMMSTSKNVSFAALFLSVQHIHAATRFITNLFRYLPSVLVIQNLETNISTKAASSFIAFLDLYSSCANWPLIANNQAILSILDSLCAKLSAPFHEVAVFEQLTASLSRGLKGNKTALSSLSINQLFSIVFKVIRKQSTDKANEWLVKYVLSSPATVLLLNTTSRNMLTADKFFPRVINCITLHKEKLFDLPGTLVLNLTANFIHLSYFEQQLLIENLYDWTCALNVLLLRCQTKTNTGKEHRSNNWCHPILGWISERVDDETAGTFPRVELQLKHLWSRRMINCLFGQVLSSFELPSVSKPSKQSKLSGLDEFGSLPAELIQKFLKKLSLRESEFTMKDVSPVSVTAIVCQLYQNVLLSFNSFNSEVLSALCLDDRLLVRLWLFVNNSSSGGVHNFLKLLSADPKVILPHFAPVHLFCDMAHSLISILDEVEMYEQSVPFTIAQICEIARFTNTFCFQCIWKGSIDFEKHRPKALFQSVYELCVLLHNRDCRRTFTPAFTFWIASDIKPSTIVSEFENHEPRAQILIAKMPHLVPLRDRMVLFRKLITKDKESTTATPCNVITVDRTRIVEDGYRQLASLSSNSLRSTIRVKFINQLGLEEVGIDQDGVFKEFLELTLKKVFDPELNLFKSTSNNLLYPSSTSSIHENHLALFQFVGRMLGKAVFEGICVDVNLAPVLLATVLGKTLLPFDELSTLDQELYKNLTFVKYYKEDLRELELTFAFTEEILGKIQTFELTPGGNDMRVTNDNKIQYIHSMAHFRVVAQTKKQCDNFVAGFRSIINPKWLSLFSTHELQFLISGQTSNIDLNDLKKHTQYYGGFHSNHRVIKWLWSILEKDFTVEERHLFLKFATSCSRPPLLGFAYLEPAFSIRCVENSDDMDQGDTLTSVIRGFLAIKRKQPSTRLPSSSTCFNLLKLPNYSKRSVLLEKLRYAIKGDVGFELS